MTPRQLRDAANRPWDRPEGCACGPHPHGSSSACSAYNVLADCDHEGLWQTYPPNICGDKPYEVLDIPHGIRCKRCGADIPQSAWAAVLIRGDD